MGTPLGGPRISGRLESPVSRIMWEHSFHIAQPASCLVQQLFWIYETNVDQSLLGLSLEVNHCKNEINHPIYKHEYYNVCYAFI